jgi:hypothetical protein
MAAGTIWLLLAGQMLYTPCRHSLDCLAHMGLDNDKDKRAQNFGLISQPPVRHYRSLK